MGLETQIRGIGLTAFWDLDTKDEDMNNTVNCLQAMAEAGKLKPILGESFSLDQATDAHIRTIENKGCLGKKYFCNPIGSQL